MTQSLPNKKLLAVFHRDHREIGARFRSLRGDLTYPQWNKKIGGVFPYSTIRHHENGGIPRPGYIARVCESQNINEDWLIHGRGPKYRSLLSHFFSFWRRAA